MSLGQRIKDAWQAFNGYHLTDWTPNRNSRVNQSQSARMDIPNATRRQLLSWSREMERKDPIFNIFLDLCERYVTGPTGIRIVSGSTTPEWAALANAEWENWQPFCDISSRFSFGQRQGLIEREVEVAGEIFIYLTYADSARPRIQLIQSESVETPAKYQTDRSVFDGVRMDANDRPLAYYVKSVDEFGKEQFREIAADSIVHIVEPSRVGQVRGLPIIYPALADMVDLRESLDLEMLAHKDGAETSKFITNALGEVSAVGLLRAYSATATLKPDGTASTQALREYYESKVGGKTIVGKHGDTYQQFANQRPGDAVQKFWDFVSARIAAGMGLPIEILIMRSLQGTMTRAALDMANGFFRCRSAARAESFNRIWNHVVMGTSSLRKSIPADWRKIRFTPPRSINVDVGRNSNALIAEWQSGFRTLENIAAEMGQDWKDILRQRSAELVFARDLEQSNSLTPGSVLQLQSAPQPAPQAL